MDSAKSNRSQNSLEKQVPKRLGAFSTAKQPQQSIYEWGFAQRCWSAPPKNLGYKFKRSNKSTAIAFEKGKALPFWISTKASRLKHTKDSEGECPKKTVSWPEAAWNMLQPAKSLLDLLVRPGLLQHPVQGLKTDGKRKIADMPCSITFYFVKKPTAQSFQEALHWACCLSYAKRTQVMWPLGIAHGAFFPPRLLLGQPTQVSGFPQVCTSTNYCCDLHIWKVGACRASMYVDVMFAYM